MKIRLMGTEDECRAVADRLPLVVGVLEISTPRANYGGSNLVRLYVEAQPDPDLDAVLPDSEWFQVSEARHALVTWDRSHDDSEYGTDRALAGHVRALLAVVDRLTSAEPGR